MTIGIDLDDVLASLMVSLVDFHNQRYKTTLTRNDFRHFDLWRTWGGNREEAIRKVYEFYEAKEFENVGTVPGAIDALASLKAMEHRLYVITARPNHIIKKTEVWLERHFPKTFDGVHFTNAFIVSGPSRKKVDVCKELGVELLIDDNLVYVNECATEGTPALLFDAPWNQGVLPAGVTRISSWDEVVRYITEKS